MLQLLSFFIFFHVSVFSFHFENNVCDHDAYYPVKFLDNVHCKRNPDVFSNTHDIIARHNFPTTAYTYVNSQGYVMTLHRIPSKNQSKPAIYLQHGILSNAVVFVDINVRSIAFFLSSLGYDVWLGNQRGVRDCKQHVSLSPTDPKFWNFNLDNLAQDVRESLHFIANQTGKAGSIIYLGHSMGTTLSFMYAARHPEEAQKLLKGIISLAPVAFIDGIPAAPIIRSIGPFVALLLKSLQIPVLVPNEELVSKIVYFNCNTAPWMCRLILRLLFGPTNQFASQDLPIFSSLFHGSTSRKQLMQFQQIFFSKKLQMFDFKRDNRKHYGQDEPPVYDLSKITVPLFLFYGLNDAIAIEKNTRRIYEAVGSQRKGMFKVPESDDSHAFSHLDFLFSKYMDKFLFPKLQQVLLDEL